MQGTSSWYTHACTLAAHLPEAATRHQGICAHHLYAGKEAAALEAALGIPVLRHREKKPAGGSEDMEAHFGWVDGLQPQTWAEF